MADRVMYELGITMDDDAGGPKFEWVEQSSTHWLGRSRRSSNVEDVF